MSLLANSYREANLARSIYQRYETMKKGISNKKRNGGKQNDASKNDDAIEKLTYPVKLLLHFSPTNFAIPLIQYLRLCVTTVKEKKKRKMDENGKR